MKTIRLTKIDGDSVWINIDMISSFTNRNHISSGPWVTDTISCVYIDSEFYLVKEKPSEICNKIDQTRREP